MVSKILTKNMRYVKWDQVGAWSYELSVSFLIKAKRVKLFSCVFPLSLQLLKR